MENVKPCSTPTTIEKSLSTFDREAMINPTIYISIVGE